MAKLPDLSQGSSLPVMQPATGIAQADARTGLEMAPARINAEAGSDLERAGLEMITADQHEKRLADAEAKRQAEIAAAEQKRQDAEAKKIAGLRAMTDFGNDVADLHQSVAEQLRTGQLAPQAVFSTFDTQVKALQDKYTQDNAPDVLEPVRIHMDNAYRDSRRQLVGTLRTYQSEKTLADFSGTVEGLERRAIRDPFGAQGAYKATAETVLASAGVPPDKIAASIQSFNERTTFNYVAGQINTVMNDMKGLQTWQKTLQDTSQYDALDPDKRRILLNQVQQHEEILKNRAQADYDRRMNQLGREMDSISRLSMQGVNPPPDRLAALAAGVKGTPYAAEFNSYLAGLNDQRTFSQLPPAQMRQQIETDMASVAKNGGTEADRIRIQRRSQQYDMAARQLTEDPLGYNARTTGTDVPPLDWQDPQKLSAGLQQRQSILLPLNQTHGASVGLLRPDEALQARQMLRSMPAVQRGAFLSQIYQAVGSGPTYNATLAQLAPDSPVTAFAGQLMAKSDVTQSHFFGADTKIVAADVGTRMLRGEDLINPPASNKADDGKTRGFQIGKEQDFAQYFNGAAGKAFPGAESQRIRDTYYQAVKAVYADLSAEAGDRNGIVDGSRVKKAFEMVTGGGVVKFGDSAVVPPFGMTGDALKSRVYQQFGAAVDAGQTSVPATYIKNAGLYQIGDGRYLVQNGTSFLPDQKTGQPLVIDVGAGPAPVPVAPTNRPAKAGKR